MNQAPSGEEDVVVVAPTTAAARTPTKRRDQAQNDPVERHAQDGFASSSGEAGTPPAPRVQMELDMQEDDALRPPEPTERVQNDASDSSGPNARAPPTADSPAQAHLKRFIAHVSLGNMPQNTTGMRPLEKLRAKAKLVIKLRQKQEHEQLRLEARMQSEQLNELRSVSPALLERGAFNQPFVDELAQVKEAHEHKLDGIRLLYTSKRWLAAVRCHPAARMRPHQLWVARRPGGI